MSLHKRPHDGWSITSYKDRESTGDEASASALYD